MQNMLGTSTYVSQDIWGRHTSLSVTSYLGGHNTYTNSTEHLRHQGYTPWLDIYIHKHIWFCMFQLDTLNTMVRHLRHNG